MQQFNLNDRQIFAFFSILMAFIGSFHFWPFDFLSFIIFANDTAPQALYVQNFIAFPLTTNNSEIKLNRRMQSEEVLWARTLTLTHLAFDYFNLRKHPFQHSSCVWHCGNVCGHLSIWPERLGRILLLFSCSCYYFSSRPMLTLFSSFVVRLAILQIHDSRAARFFFAIRVSLRNFPPSRNQSKRIKCSTALT